MDMDRMMTSAQSERFRKEMNWKPGPKDTPLMGGYGVRLSALPIGVHIFEARPIARVGNVDPDPAWVSCAGMSSKWHCSSVY